MRHLPATAFLFLIAITGCHKEGTSTAPGTNPQQPGETRRLTVTSPGEQNITQNQTDKLTVSIGRDNFKGNVRVELRNLPPGIAAEPKDPTIQTGNDSIDITLRAAPDAKPMDDHVVTVAAWAPDQKDLKEATTTFKLDVIGKARMLSVTSPGDQSVMVNKTGKVSVSIDRQNFKGPVQLEFSDLPEGVSVASQDLTVPEGKDSMEVSLKAAADAKPVEDHLVKVKAWAKDQREINGATASFKLDVKKE